MDEINLMFLFKSLQNARFCLLPTTVFTKLMIGQADDTLDCYFVVKINFVKFQLATSFIYMFIRNISY